MSEPFPSQKVLQSHLELLSELHELFLEESALLRASGLPPDEAFYRLAEGLAAQNSMDDLAAVDMTIAMVFASAVTLGPGNPGALYAVDIGDWFLGLAE